MNMYKTINPMKDIGKYTQKLDKMNGNINPYTVELLLWNKIYVDLTGPYKYVGNICLN